MKSNKVLSIFVFLLIIINLALIAFIWFNRPNDRSQQHPQAFHQRMLTRQLGFNNDQEEAFSAAISEFKPIQQEIGEELFQTRRVLHESIFNPKINVDSLVHQIEVLEGQHAKLLLEHQQKIYQICNERQKKEFINLTNQTIRYQRRHGGMRGNH